MSFIWRIVDGVNITVVEMIYYCVWPKLISAVVWVADGQHGGTVS